MWEIWPNALKSAQSPINSPISSHCLRQKSFLIVFVPVENRKDRSSSGPRCLLHQPDQPHRRLTGGRQPRPSCRGTCWGSCLVSKWGVVGSKIVKLKQNKIRKQKIKTKNRGRSKLNKNQTKKSSTKKLSGLVGGGKLS